MAKEPSDGSYDEDIYPEDLGHAVPEPLPLANFQPWHLPRKQWVRNIQWKTLTKRLVRSLNLEDRPLRYLGLPGTELLDLEVLASWCAENNLRFRYLGFNSGAQSRGAQTTQQLAEDLLRSISGVDTTSIVCTDDIITLASKRSLAYNRLYGYESFDVVNLDLCDVFTTQQGRAVHEAVKNIVEYQVNARTQPWLLFITTAIDRDAVSDADVEQYARKFDENCAKWDEFKSITNTMAGRVATADGSPFNDVTGMRFGKLLAVAIGKWLASVLKEPLPWKVELKSCVGYRRGMTGLPAGQLAVREPELFSMVFGMSRPAQQLEDPLGIVEMGVRHADADWATAERGMALQIAMKADNTLDLDKYLQDRPEVYRELTDDAATLMSFRNYDVGAFRQFAASIAKLPVGG